jgi:hypothetical protein
MNLVLQLYTGNAFKMLQRECFRVGTVFLLGNAIAPYNGEVSEG